MSSYEVVELIVDLFGLIIFLGAIVVSPIMLLKRVIKDDEKDIVDVICLVYIIIYTILYFLSPEVINGFNMHVAFEFVEVIAYLWVAISLYKRSEKEESDFVKLISIVTFVACFISIVMHFI